MNFIRKLIKLSKNFFSFKKQTRATRNKVFNSYRICAMDSKRNIIPGSVRNTCVKSKIILLQRTNRRNKTPMMVKNRRHFYKHLAVHYEKDPNNYLLYIILVTRCNKYLGITAPLTLIWRRQAFKWGKIIWMLGRTTVRAQNKERLLIN